MVAEAGKNWNKEVGTLDNSVDAQRKRTEFYTERVKAKLGQSFDEIVNDLSGKGYKTMEELKGKDHSQDIKSGDTLFVILRDYFNGVLGGGAQAGADNEAYLSLAVLMRDNSAINVDDLKAGGKIKIEDGYLTLTDSAGALVVDHKALRRESSGVPSAKPEAPAIEPKPTPVEVEKAPAPVEQPTPNLVEQPAPALDMKQQMAANPPVPEEKQVPNERAKTLKEEIQEAAAKAAPVDAPAEIVQEKVITKEEIAAKYSGIGRYTDEFNNNLQGTFENGLLVSGLRKWANGEIETGNFEKYSGILIEGTWTSADGTSQEAGIFDASADNRLLDGVRVRDGVTEYIFPESKLSEYENLMKGKRPGKKFKPSPYQAEGNKVVFKEEGMLWGTNDRTVVTVENPEKAVQLARLLNSGIVAKEVAAPASVPQKTPVLPSDADQQVIESKTVPTEAHVEASPEPVPVEQAAPNTPRSVQTAPVLGSSEPTE